MNIFSRRVIRLIVIGISAVLIVNLSRSIWDLWRRRDILGEREAVLRRLEAENKHLQSELEYTQSPEFIEQEARNRLGLGREGEAVVLMPNDQFPMTNGKTEEKQEETLPSRKKWWRLFF
ncbi:septum formation initiator family protein [Candidatus Gottesmanbacteria bacterium]|nr:septum formation initiator family protein [Candidatus Gottesmanbacteria bacterium]